MQCSMTQCDIVVRVDATLRRTLSGVPSCILESSCVGRVQVAALSSANKSRQTLISICAPRDASVSTLWLQLDVPYYSYLQLLFSCLHINIIHIHLVVCGGP